MNMIASWQLIDFYLEQGSDHKGRTLADIWAMPNFWLEHTHDYIQWLFPIPEQSKFNQHAPVLTEVIRYHFAQNQQLRENQQRSLDLMLEFYGLVRDGLRIGPSAGLNMRDYPWLKPGGHNHLRITRMIRSLHLCHQPELAKALQQAVLEIGESHGQISEKAKTYWRKATET